MKFERLGDHIEQVRGVSYKPEDAIDIAKDGYLPILRSNNIEEGKINFADLIFLPSESIKEKQKLKEGDILITASTGSKKVIGKNGAAEQDFDASFGAFCKVVRPKKSLDKNYLKHFFQTPYYRNTIRDAVNGANINNIKNEHLNDLKFPLPPLATQKKIASILDAANAHRQKTKQLFGKYDELAQSIFLEMFGDPITNPKGWEEKKMGEICGVGSSKRVFVNELMESGIPFYRGTEVGNLATGDSIIPSLHISHEHYEELKGHTGAPKIGDLLMPSICPDGRIWKVNTTEPFYFKDGRVLWIKINHKVFKSRYLLFLLKQLFRANYHEIASGTTFAELKIIALKNLNVLLPDIKLQGEFEERINSLEAQKELLSQEVLSSENLFNSLLQKAFKRELVK